MKSKFFFSLLFLLINVAAQGKNLQDTLFYKNFLSIVKAYHPIAQQANLLSGLAQAKRTKALGGFDPKIEAEFDQKYFNGTRYYSFFTPQLKLPLWYGVELKGSYSTADGVYLNPESKLPKEGLAYAGISFNLGKGLFIDERRADLKKAQIFAESYKNEGAIALNDLFLDAGTQYIDWQTKYKLVKVYQNALKLAKERQRAVILSVKNGDKPAIDSVEALLTVRQREISLQEANLDFKSSQQLLSDFLWRDNNQNVDANKLEIVPQDLFIQPVDVNGGISDNPKLLNYDFKIKELNIERKLKADNLKPELKVQLGLLNEGKTFIGPINSAYYQNNNKVNVGFSFPLTLAKARGDLAETKIKIKQTELAQIDLRNQLTNKITQNNFEIATLESQLKLLQSTYTFSNQLLAGEETKFKLGESSLFLINSRENKLIEVTEKLLNTEFKLHKAKIKNLWILGNLGGSIDDEPDVNLLK